MVRKKKKKPDATDPAPELAPTEQFLAAVLSPDPAAVLALLDAQELRVEEPDDEGHTPLWLSAVHGATSVVQVLLQAGASVDQISPGEQATALHGAVIHGHDATVCALLSAKADIEARSACGQTALMHACSAALVSTASCLLDNGADPDATNETGCTALVLSNSVTCCELLLRHYAAKLPEPPQVPRAHDYESASGLLSAPFIRPPRESRVGLWLESCLGGWELLGKEREVVFPFHHLPDYASEVMHVCTVAELMLGKEYRAAIAAIAPDPGLDSALYQSCLYGILEAAKHLITCESCGQSSQDAAIAREELQHFTVAAFREVYGDAVHLDDPAASASVCGALVDMLAAALFGSSFWSKRALFLCEDPVEQRRLWSHQGMQPARYFQQVPLEVAPTHEAVTSAERRLHAYTSAGCALVADVIPGIHPAYSEMTMRQMLLDCELLHHKTRDGSLRRTRKKKKKQAHLQQQQQGGLESTELAAGVRGSIEAFWRRLDRGARRELLQIPDQTFDDAIRKSEHWDLLKHFDENYDEFGPKGLLDIEDSTGHITVGKGLLGVEAIGAVLDAQPAHGGLVADRSAGKALYEGLALWLMRQQLLQAHGESSREEAALRLQDELILAEEREQAAKNKAKPSKGKGSKPAPSKALSLDPPDQSSDEEPPAPPAPPTPPTPVLPPKPSPKASPEPKPSPASPSEDSEARRDPKVRLCQRYFNTGECNRRHECWYAHSLEEFEPTARRNFKTRFCHAFQSGSCKFGACCTFAHGPSQLRALDDPVVLPKLPSAEPRPRPAPAVPLPVPLPKPQQRPKPSNATPARPEPLLPVGPSAFADASDPVFDGFARSSDPIFSPGAHGGRARQAVGQRSYDEECTPLEQAVLGPLDL